MTDHPEKKTLSTEELINLREKLHQQYRRAIPLWEYVGGDILRYSKGVRFLLKDKYSWRRFIRRDYWKTWATTIKFLAAREKSHYLIAILTLLIIARLVWILC